MAIAEPPRPETLPEDELTDLRIPKLTEMGPLPDEERVTDFGTRIPSPEAMGPLPEEERADDNYEPIERFGHPIDEGYAPPPEPRRPHFETNQKPTWLDPLLDKGADYLKGQKEKLLERKAAQAAAKQAGRRVATQTAERAAVRTGATVATHAGGLAAAEAAGAAAGPVGWVVDVGLLAIEGGLLLLQAFKNPKVQKFIMAGSLVVAGFGVLLFINALAIISGCHSNGANPDGARCLREQTGTFAPAVAANDRGLTAASSLELLDASRAKIAALLDRGQLRLSASQIQKAKDLLNQMHELRAKMQSSAYASDPEYMAEHITEYRKLMVELYDTVYPGAGTARARVKALVASGVIKPINFSQCRPGLDIESGPLTPTLLNTMATIGEYAATKGMSFQISCIKTGHRPGSGNRISQHWVGQAFDIDVVDGNDPVARTILPYLQETHAQNPALLNLRQVIFNDPVNGNRAGYYNLRYTTPDKTHRDHIHIGVTR